METLPANPETKSKHRSEVFWQITLPLILGGLLLGGACVLFSIRAFGQGGDVGVWRDISLIWLILPLMLVSLIPLVILGALGYGITKLLGIAPGYMVQAQNIFKNISAAVENISRKIKVPFDKIRAMSERIRTRLKRNRLE